MVTRLQLGQLSRSILNDSMTRFATGSEELAKSLESLGEAPGKRRCEEALSPDSGPVCVTGVTGFVALHVVEQLLEKGYTVVGTVRSESDPVKMAPVKAFQEKYGEEKFRIVPGVDLLKAESFEPAVKGCVGVFHTASPFHFKATEPIKELVMPAVEGTEACLAACKAAGGVKRVIVTSSFAAIVNKPGKPEDYAYSSKEWNIVSLPDGEGKFQEPVAANGYRYSKTAAEKAAWDFAAAEDCPFDVAAINPPVVVGKNHNRPATEADLNTSSGMFLKILQGALPPMPNSMPCVDVVDVARSHLLAYERPEAGGRRFLCASAEVLNWTELAKLLKEIRPDLPVITDAPAAGEGLTLGIDCSGLTNLGLVFTPLKETLRAQCESLVELGFVAKAS